MSPSASGAAPEHRSSTAVGKAAPPFPGGSAWHAVAWGTRAHTRAPHAYGCCCRDEGLRLAAYEHLLPALVRASGWAGQADDDTLYSRTAGQVFRIFVRGAELGRGQGRGGSGAWRAPLAAAWAGRAALPVARRPRCLLLCACLLACPRPCELARMLASLRACLPQLGTQGAVLRNVCGL